MSRRRFLLGLAAVPLLPGSSFAAEPPQPEPARPGPPQSEPSQPESSRPEPALPEPLRALRETLRRPLPTRFTAKSKLTWPNGVVSGQYDFRGSPERCLLRCSLISIGRLQGAPYTQYAQRVVRHGGTWIDEPFGDRIQLGNGRDTLIVETLRSRTEDKLQPELRRSVRSARAVEIEPRENLAGIGIAFGYRDREVFPELWASHPDEQITVRPARERIDGAETVVVQFLSAAERRTLWLDPQRRMLPCQIEIVALESDRERVGVPHRFTQAFRDDFSRGRRAFYHKFRFQTVEGEPWITGFGAEFEGDDQTWKPCVLEGEYAIESLRFDAPLPTDAELEEGLEIPQGTSINIQLPDGRGSPGGLWQDGRIRQGGVGFF